MCGIAGWLSWDEPVDPNVVERITNALAHRGPDASGVKNLGPVVLGHRRLSIIDCAPTNDQPLSDVSGKFWLAFNGEIYNYLEIKRDLQSLGAVFKTQGDTEVVLEAYKQWGVDCLQRLTGMFSLALWDADKERLFLARDRMGEKPLFYCTPSAGSFVFASEPQALRKHLPMCREVDATALAQYLSLNYTVGDRTLIKGVSRLAPAHFILIEKNKQPRIECYWDLSQHFKNKKTYQSEEQACDQLQSLITEAVRGTLVSDVPLGAFLSGGVDSSTIVAAMARLGNPSQVKTFSIGFKEETFDEVKEARAAAHHLGVDHYDRLLSPDPELLLRSLIRAADEPVADTSFLPTYCLAQFAREKVTVALSGDGGDECFAGYETYAADLYHQHLSKLPSWFWRSIERVAANALPVSFSKVSFDYKAKQFLAGLQLDASRAHCSWRSIFSDEERGRLMRADWQEMARNHDPFSEFERHFEAVKDCHLIDQAMYVDIKTWLPDDILVKVDRATMAHALESRAPFLNHHLVEFAASLPIELKMKGLRKKHILKQSQRRILPQWLLDRRKKGFSAPVSHWFAGPLKQLAREALNEPALKDWFNAAEVDRLWQEHERKERDNGYRLFGLTCLAMWLKESVTTDSSPASKIPSLITSSAHSNRDATALPL
jgi:asparagine synthase (glutamine-hydrolysing)